MTRLKLNVTEVDTGKQVRDEACDMCLAICVNREEDRETEWGREECLASSIALLGPVSAPYTMSAISAASTAIGALTTRAMERVAPIEWAARRNGLEKIRDELRAALEKVEVLCATASAVREV